MTIQPASMLSMRLEEWARWAHTSAYNRALWYPSETSTHREPRGRSQGNPRAEEIEALVQRLAIINPSWAGALRLHWIDRRHKRAKAREMGIPVTRFYDLAHQAEAWLLGRIDGLDSNSPDLHSIKTAIVR